MKQNKFKEFEIEPKIESGIPIPNGRWLTLLSKMKPGDSVLLTPEEAHVFRNTIRRHYKQTGYVSVERKIGNKQRIWVIKPKSINQLITKQERQTNQ